MPSTIHILPQNLANKIAAGEVVQRPASALKELLENSLDAHAKSISVIIKDGGKTLLQVVDDGAGMNSEDALVAFSRHATSKISTYEDLENIRTLGFRGEALASIAAVAQVEMKTRRKEDDVATLVRIDGGEVKEHHEAAFQTGTFIAVKNLFYNTPGRRNFLKSDATEYRHILEVVQRLALASPQVGFSFVSNDETIFRYSPEPLEQRIAAVLGENLSSNLIEVRRENEKLQVKGFVGKPRFARKGKPEQFLYLNNRFILNRSIGHAVYQGFEHLLEKGTFPVFVLFLTVDPRSIDVNVHPSKMEVKFDDESSVYRLIFHAVKDALGGSDSVPSIVLPPTENAPQALRFTQQQQHSDRSADWRSAFQRASEVDVLFQRPATGSESLIRPHDHESLVETAPVWQLHRKYIILPSDEGMLIIDQHAAHERIIYEQVKKRAEEGVPSIQQLLFPLTVELQSREAALLSEMMSEIDELGFSLRFFGKTTVMIDGVPSDIRPGRESTILQELIEKMTDKTFMTSVEPKEKLLQTFACKAAVKSGDTLKESEMRGLLQQLMQTKIPFSCPHGRPSMIRLELSELDRRFGRTS